MSKNAWTACMASVKPARTIGVNDVYELCQYNISGRVCSESWLSVWWGRRQELGKVGNHLFNQGMQMTEQCVCNEIFLEKKINYCTLKPAAWKNRLQLLLTLLILLLHPTHRNNLLSLTLPTFHLLTQYSFYCSPDIPLALSTLLMLS